MMNILLINIFTALVAVCSAHTAVVVLTGSGVNGTVRFEQFSPDVPVTIIGNINGLAPNASRGFHIHQFGNLTGGCLSTGAHFNPFGRNHGAPADPVRHVGDLGNIQSDAFGVANFNFTDSVIDLFNSSTSIIGRGLVVHNGTDDLGRGNNADSLTTGNSGARLACGVIETA